MAASSGHLTKLVALAHERSSDKRRELLRDMSQLFITSEEVRTNQASRAISDDILLTLAKEMEASVRAELAERFADHPDAPPALVNNLALDVIEVARPLLERSKALSEATLVQSIRRHGAEHARVVAARSDVSDAVAAAVVETRDDEAMVALIQNEDVTLSRATMEKLVDHAESAPALHESLVERAELPPDLLNEMFVVVKERLRQRIVERQESFDQETIDAAFRAAEERLARKSGARPKDYDDAVRYVAAKKLRRKLTHDLLAELLIQGEHTKFAVAFADLTGLQYPAAKRAIDNPAIDPIAIACRAAGFAREDFVRIAVLRPTTAVRQKADADTLGEIYDALDPAAADRVMRFVKLRDQNASSAA